MREARDLAPPAGCALDSCNGEPRCLVVVELEAGGEVRMVTLATCESCAGWLTVGWPLRICEWSALLPRTGLLSVLAEGEVVPEP